VTHEELATTTVRVAAAPVAATPGNDGYQVELDYAWLDLYGWEKPRPAEVAELRVDRLADGTLELSFEPLAGAQRYNVYPGALDALRVGEYDHGTAALCGAATVDAGGGRLKVLVADSVTLADGAYFLVTGHADDVESPSGRDSDGEEIDRSQSLCR
jgi:hypothetical protein